MREITLLFENRIQNARYHVDNLYNEMKANFLNLNHEEIVEKITQDYRLEKTVLKTDKLTRSEIGDLNILESESDSFIQIKIPYSGGNYFNIYKTSSPSILDITWKFRLSHILSVYEGYIQFSISFDRIKALNDIEYLEKKIKQKVDIYARQVELLNSKIDEFNNSLPQIIKEQISEYKTSITERNEIDEKIGIPLDSYQIVPKTVIDLIEKERPLKTLEIHTDKLRSEYLKEHLIDQAYWDILSIFHDVGVAMERNPEPFIKFKEEPLRNILLAVLSAFYVGIPTGETFSVKGKSDILLFKENTKTSLFISECKIRSGIGKHKNFNYVISEAIKQLSKYLTWGDEKTAVIVFNKLNDTTKLIKEVKNQIEKSKDYIEPVKIPKTISIGSNRIKSFKLRHPKDTMKHYVLTYLFLNLSQSGVTKVPKSRKKRKK